MNVSDQHTPDTREEAASKLPALHILLVMGWSYLPPAEALTMRGSERSVLLDPVLREWLAAHRFDFKGRQHPLSESGINQVIKAITATKLNEGLIAANEAIYKQLTLGITVDEFVGGDKTSVSVQDQCETPSDPIRAGIWGRPYRVPGGL